MTRAVRWYKNDPHDTAIVQVYENGKWVNARNSAIYKPDVTFEGSHGKASEGFATFQNALRLGYVNKGLHIQNVEKSD